MKFGKIKLTRFDQWRWKIKSNVKHFIKFYDEIQNVSQQKYLDMNFYSHILWLKAAQKRIRQTKILTYLFSFYRNFYQIFVFFKLKMERRGQKAVIICQNNKKPEIRHDFPKPFLKQGELLIKVEASTVNPSDRYFLQGHFSQKPRPALCGTEGTGRVIEARGEGLQHWIGKRVSFTSSIGAWCEYAVSSPLATFHIDEDVPLCSASSGVVNPLAAIGILQTYKQSGCKGIIITAGASSLGRMVARLCLKENINLLSLVRNEQQAYELKKEGALHIVVTKGEWELRYEEYIQKYGFNCAFDALGGGPVTETIISNLTPGGYYYLIGTLQNKPLHLSNSEILYSGITIGGFSLFVWWSHTSEEAKNRVRSQYSTLLKNELRTKTCKEMHMKSIQEAIQLSANKATQGKIMIKID